MLRVVAVGVTKVLAAGLIGMASTVFVVGILVTILCAALFCAIAWTAVFFVVDPGISRTAINSTIANAVIGVGSPVILVLLATLDS